MTAEEEKLAKKFDSSNKEEESPSLVAQRLINIFRQLHILNEEAVKRYNEMLLSTSEEIISLLPSMPSGTEVREYLEFLKRKKENPNIEEDQIFRPKKRISPEMLEEKKPETPTAAPSQQASGMSPEMTQKLISAMIEVQQKTAESQAEIISTALGQTQENLVHLMTNSATGTPVKDIQIQQAGSESPLLEKLADAIRDTQEKTNQTLLDILKKTQRTAGDTVVTTEGNPDVLKELIAAMAETQMKAAESQAKIIAEALASAQEKQKNMMEAQSFKLVREQAKVLAQAHHDAQELARQQLDVLSRNLIDVQEKISQKTNDPLSMMLKASGWTAPQKSVPSSQILADNLNQSNKGFDYVLPAAEPAQEPLPQTYQNSWGDITPTYPPAENDVSGNMYNNVPTDENYMPEDMMYMNTDAGEMPMTNDYQDMYPQSSEMEQNYNNPTDDYMQMPATDVNEWTDTAPMTDMPTEMPPMTDMAQMPTDTVPTDLSETQPVNDMSGFTEVLPSDMNNASDNMSSEFEEMPTEPVVSDENDSNGFMPMETEMPTEETGNTIPETMPTDLSYAENTQEDFNTEVPLVDTTPETPLSVDCSEDGNDESTVIDFQPTDESFMPVENKEQTPVNSFFETETDVDEDDPYQICLKNRKKR